MQEPKPHLTIAGRYVVYGLGIVAGLVVFGLLLQACIRAPRYAYALPPGQGYETPAGYMEPDHSWVYYWTMNQLLLQDRRPSYHVYVPPPSYPATFRPWHDDTPYRPKRVYVPAPEPAPYVPTRTNGGFASPPSQPSQRAVAPTRQNGGFTHEERNYTPSAPSRTSGGFSTASKPAPAAPSRTNGGFSSPKASTPPSKQAERPAPSRTSGGFSTTSPKKK